MQHPVVTYDPTNPPSETYPGRQWFHDVWAYLRRQLPGDLSPLQGLPILPVVDTENLMEVLPLDLPATAVVSSAMGTALTPECMAMLEVCGLRVVRDLPKCVKTHAAVVGNYVRLPLPEDVLDGLSTAVLKKKAPQPLEKVRELTSVDEKKHLRILISRVNPRHVDKQQMETIRSLPVFTVYSKSDDKPQFVSLNEVDRAAPLIMPPVNINTKLVDLKEDDARYLAKVVGVKPMPVCTLLRETVLRDVVKGEYGPSDIQPVMSYIMEQLPTLVIEDPTFQDYLKSVPFVSTAGGKLAKACDLYNPKSEFLQRLFYGEDVFPGEEYRSETCINLLRQLGLKEKTKVSAQELLQCAQYIGQVSSAGELEERVKAALTKKAELILQCLDHNPTILYEDVNELPLVCSLIETSWVPTNDEKPPLYPESLPWFKSPEPFTSPKNIKSVEWYHLVGSVMSLNTRNVHQDVAASFSWSLPPSASVVIQQLQMVIEHYKSKDKDKYLIIITKIYQELAENHVSELQHALKKHQVTDWAWHGDGFVPCERITMQPPFMGLEPYMYALPRELLQYEPMFQECGANPICDERCLVDILSDIRDKHMGSKVDLESTRRDLQLAIDILNKIQNDISFDGELEELLLIPVATDEEDNLKLVPVEEATYCDTEWLRQGFDLMEFDEQDGINFIHPLLPTKTAAAFGVPTLMSRMLHAEELNVTGFGQSEPLTNRLKCLLDDYTDGLAIPKELIQNADDAGATEVSFLYDERHNSDHMKYLIDEGMKDCHGPALWVHNNALFSDEDFENITKLGGATKETQPDKIGKFGLGFNAVYNVTDVPSFISRDFIVIFDPHTTHLGRGIRDRSRPGIKIEMKKNRTLLKKLPDQFQPYQDVFGCNIAMEKDIKANYDGTLFRLPLRTLQQASRSEICSITYDKDEMRKLIKMVISSGPNLMLYTQNVTSVKFYHLTADAASPSEAKLIFQVHKEQERVSRPLTSISPKSPATSRNALKIYAQQPVSEFNMLKVGSDYLERMAQSKTRKLVSEYDTPAKSLVAKMTCEVTEDADKLIEGVGACVTEQHWLLSYACGYKQSLNFAIGARDNQKGYNTMGSVAVALKKTEDGFVPVPLEEMKKKGTVFCYLPLPGPSGLPVHINASFAVQSSRRYLVDKNEDDKENVNAEWNEVLLGDAVLRAYIQAMRDAQLLSPAATAVKFYSLWPCKAHVSPTMIPLLEGFYNYVVANPSIPAWHDGTQLITMERAVFLDPALANRPTIAELVMDTFRQNKSTANVVEVPPLIIESLATTGHTEFIRRKTYTQARFFKEIFFNDIIHLGPETRDPLVLYALDRNIPELDRLLRESSCIPVTPNGKRLRKPCELVHPVLQVSKMYSPEEGFFPHGKEFIVSQRLTALQKLGMQSQDLSWNCVIERASSIAMLLQNDRDAAKKRSAHLLTFLDRKLSASQHSTEEEEQVVQWARNRLRQTAILPIMGKPKDFPLPWKGEEYEANTLLAPDDIQIHEFLYLLSSTQPIVDENTMTKNVKYFLGMNNREVEIEHVMTQLEQAMNVNPQEITKKQVKDLYKVCYKIYAFLQVKCHDDEETAESVVGALSERKCILLNEVFLTPKQLTFATLADCAPYLYSVPPDMAHKFKELFKLLGVREKFAVDDHMTVINEMHRQADNTVLQARDLELSLRAVALLNGSMKRENKTAKEVEEEHGTIYVPNVAGVLQPASVLCYNDCPWLQNTGNTNFTHPDITYQVAKLLGVKTKRQEALQKHAHGIPFGQKERLSNSLKRILNSYPCDHEILKELIQNADDSQATEIHFILDGRQHGGKHVFDRSWQPLQGPGLVVYNNKPFRQLDIEGIQKLGEGSKLEDPNKTGQYGVGFSSVYHLTDVPSLLTSGEELGETLCVFDPNCLYVPFASSDAPGMQYTDIKDLRETFPDVFTCYMEDQLKLENSTIFRFPLRNQAMALTSEISKKTITTGVIQGLFSKLILEIFDILLFTNYLTQISVSEVDIASGKIINTYRVRAELSEEDTEKRHEFYEYVSSTSAQLKSGEIKLEEIVSQSVSYKVKISDCLLREETWVVSQHIGVEEGTTVPDTITTAFANRDLMLLPRGGCAALMEKRQGEQIIQESQPRRVFCFLPLPLETSLPVHINGHFALGYENRRHIWTNQDGLGYKQDWNNFLSTEVIALSYLKLMLAIRMEGLKAEINDDVGKVHCQRQLLDSAIKAYQQYFPDLDPLRSQWNSLVTSFYQKSAALETPLLPAIKEDLRQMVNGTGIQNNSQWWDVLWLPPKGQGCKKAFFTEMERAEPVEEQTSFLGKFKNYFRSSQQPAIKSERQILKEVLLDCNFKLLEATQRVMDNYKMAEVDVDYMSPEGVLLFFQSYTSENPMCEIGTIPAPLARTPFRDEGTLKIVLRYCQKDGRFLEKLDGTPLLLTGDANLRNFSSENPVFFTLYNDLIPECGERFLHRTVQSEIFQGIDPLQVPVFCPLTIEALGTILECRLPKDMYFEQKEPVKWARGITKPVNTSWIQKVWGFIRSQTEDTFKNRDLQGNDLRMQLQIQLEPINDWSIIPAKTPTDYYLVSLKNASGILDLRQVEFSDYAVRDVLRSMRTPELACDVLNVESTKSSDLLHHMVTTLDRPFPVLRLVHTHVTNKQMRVRPEDAEKILRYFGDNIGRMDESTEAFDLLCALPFYRTIHGDTISITGCLVYTLPPKIPTNDIDVWQSKSGTVFLERNNKLAPLYDFLKCARISTTEVYCKFILQHFEYLTPVARTVHLKHIYHHYLREGPGMDPSLTQEEKAELLESLKGLNFIEDKEGQLHQASEFYDPENVLFRVMLAEEQLPPRAGTQFRESEWLDLLRKLGLQSEVTKEQVVGFAEQVAHEGKLGESGHAVARSKTLTEHLLTMQNTFRDEILETVSEVRFIAPEHVHRDHKLIYAQYGDTGTEAMPFVSFKDSLSKDYENVVWTRASILPSWADPMKQQLPQEDRLEIMECLGVRKKPPPTLVVSHLITLCDHVSSGVDKSLLEDPMKRHTLKKAFKAAYRFLQDNGLEDPEVRDRLAQVPCVLVDDGRKLMEAKYTAVNMYESEEIRPYLYKVPVELGEFHVLFQYIGSTDAPSVDQYASVLERLQSKAGTLKLTPRELIISFRAVKGLFTTLEETEGLGDINTQCLYIPSESGHLIDSSCLVFNDAPHFYDRVLGFGLQFLFDVKECGMKFRNIEDLLNRLPQKLRPAVLSSYVKECLVEKAKKSVTTTGIAADLAQRLTCEVFMKAVMRLVRHETHRSGRKLEEQSMFDILDRLSTIHVYAVSQLQTHLTYKGRSIKGSQVDKSCFVEKVLGRPDTWNVYIREDAKLEQDLLIPLADVINSILNGILRDSVLFLLPILACSLDKIDSKLDSLNVRLDQSQATKRASTLPSPGTPVHPDHQLLLHQDDGKHFMVDQYVGYRGTPDAEPVYAKIVEGASDEYGQTITDLFLVNLGEEKDCVVSSKFLYCLDR